MGSLAVSSDFAVDPEAQQLASIGPEASSISRHVNLYLLWAGLGAAALGAALVWLFAGRTLAPVQRLGATARRLGQGDLSKRAEVTGPTEIRQLAHSFNAMASELEEAEARRRSLTADIAHELRTPTSNIQGYIEAIKDGVFQPNEETIDTIHEQSLLLVTACRRPAASCPGRLRRASATAVAGAPARAAAILRRGNAAPG